MTHIDTTAFGSAHLAPNPTYPLSEARNSHNYAIFILSIPPILDSLLSNIDSSDVLRSKRVCKAFYSAIQHWERFAYNINRRLKKFFNDPLEFRGLQAATDMLISGLFALRFLDRIDYPDAQLELFVSVKHAHKITRWILSNGYEYRPPNNDDNDDDDGGGDDGDDDNDDEVEPDMEDVLNSVIFAAIDITNLPDTSRPLSQALPFTHQERPKQRVLLNLCRADYPPIACILFLHSTCIMNYISWNKAVSMYPSATFQHRQSLLLNMTGGFGDSPQEYKHHGIEFISRALLERRNSSTPSPNPFTYGARAIEDRQSWVMTLSTEGLMDTKAFKIPKHKHHVNSELLFSWHLLKPREYEFGDRLGWLRNPQSGVGLAASLVDTKHLRNKYLVHVSVLVHSDAWVVRHEKLNELNSMVRDHCCCCIGSGEGQSENGEPDDDRASHSCHYLDEDFAIFHNSLIRDLQGSK